MDTKKYINKSNLKKIDFAFLDAEHNSDYIEVEYKFVKSKQQKGDIIIFDDYDEKYSSLKKFINDYVFKEYDTSCLESTKDRHYLICTKK